MKKIKYILYLPFELFFAVIRKIVGHRNFGRNVYGFKIIHRKKYLNKYISKLILEKKPFLISRFGDAELKTVVQTYQIDFGFRKDYSEKLKYVMHNNAGFFPATTNNLYKFSEIMTEAACNVDLFGVWFNFMESYVISNVSPKAKLVKLEALEPYRFSNPWSKCLAGKKVLVVHPFSESIKKQYKKRQLLFKNQDVLPTFELIVYKTVQTNAGATSNFKDWFEALNHMFTEIKTIDFDIAIVGCGAYGLPLASMIKGLGKGVIHLAGATQILFGIRGARWDSRKDMQNMFNENWIRPQESEKPKNAQKVEGGCYW